MAAAAIPELDRRGLRAFGITTGLAVAALFGLTLPWLLEHPIPLWPWALAAALVAAGLAAPKLLRPIYRGWMRFGLLMSRVTTPLLLGVLFIAIVTPIARVRALRGHDPLARRAEPQARSYRVPSAERSARDLERPF
jgi:hypothetical protein